MSIIILTPVDRFHAILKTYASWTDPLSQRLHKQGKKINSSNLLLVVETLVTKILVNPLGNQRLQSPLLDRKKWVWEKLFLEHYQTQTDNAPSPFDKGPIVAEPHAFAIAILAWIQKINRKDQVTSEAESKIKENFLNEPKALVKIESPIFRPEKNLELARQTLLNYIFLAQRFIQKEQERAFYKTLQATSKEMDTKILQVQEETLEIRRKNAAHQLGFNHLIKKETAHIAETRKTECKVRTTHEEESKNYLEKTQRELEALRNTSANQVQRIQEIRNELGT